MNKTVKASKKLLKVYEPTNNEVFIKTTEKLTDHLMVSGFYSGLAIASLGIIDKNIKLVASGISVSAVSVLSLYKNTKTEITVRRSFDDANNDFEQMTKSIVK